ncbi:MAG: hypothetical protein OEW56_06700, partial [Gemmatimonadota bacterium]|nr:hypothetical protein [Gemmatimonadota bacterium]
GWAEPGNEVVHHLERVEVEEENSYVATAYAFGPDGWDRCGPGYDDGDSSRQTRRLGWQMVTGEHGNTGTPRTSSRDACNDLSAPPEARPDGSAQGQGRADDRRQCPGPAREDRPGHASACRCLGGFVRHRQLQWSVRDTRVLLRGQLRNYYG